MRILKVSEVNAMQILIRAKLTNRDIAELKTAYEIELQREAIDYVDGAEINFKG